MEFNLFELVRRYRNKDLIDSPEISYVTITNSPAAQAKAKQTMLRGSSVGHPLDTSESNLSAQFQDVINKIDAIVGGE